jgi:hypothetical protein
MTTGEAEGGSSNIFLPLAEFLLVVTITRVGVADSNFFCFPGEIAGERAEGDKHAGERDPELVVNNFEEEEVMICSTCWPCDRRSMAAGEG